ncbi:MAG: alcohol dehydrogenase [Acidobacteria bacterium]|nr:MAG: alcohol dehydrogenase [Acidobacteriota bacterium]
MRVAQLDFADPEFPVSIVEKPSPDLPGPQWARIRVTGGGICGSDLHLFKPTTGQTPMLMSYVAMPMELGHEISGIVLEAGPGFPIDSGERVAVDPVMGCVARGIEPLCPQCAIGAAASCHNLASREVTPGFMIGYTNGLGSGWADEVVVHESMLHLVPDAVADEAVVLHEPLSVVIHGVLRRPPRDGDRVLIVGAGIIGLCAVAAIKSLFPACHVTVVAKHDHQQDAARSLGADEVVAPASDGSHISELAKIAETHVVGTGMLAGGFQYVIEAVGAPGAISECLRSVGGGGTIIFLGAAGVTEVDLTPLWFKEVTVAGSFCHASDPHGAEGLVHSVDLALDVLASGALPHDLVITHEFPLGQLREAVETALGRGETGALKVVLRPQDMV